MKSIRFITLSGLSLLTLGLTGAAQAQTQTFKSRVSVSAMPTDETTDNGSDVLFEGMYGYKGVAGYRPDNRFFNIEGSATGTAPAGFYGFAAVQFDTQYLKNLLNAAYPTGYTVTGMYLSLSESNAAFTTPGNLLISFVKSEADVQPFGYAYAKTAQTADPYSATGNAEPFLEPGGSWTSTAGAAGQEQVEVFPFATTGAVNNAQLDLIPLYGVATGVPAVNNPSDPTGAHGTDLVNHFLGNNALTVVFNADPTTPKVAATYSASTRVSGTTQYYTPQLIVVAKAGSSVTQPPSIPTLAGVADDQKVTLTWTPSTGATSYTLYRSNASGAETSYKTGLGGTTFTDTGLTNGVTYYYKITASNSAGESGKSNEISATPFLNPPAAPVLTGSAATGLVQLNWTATAHAVTYTLYRSTTPGAEVSYKTNLSRTSLTDFGLTNGTTYYYQVTAVDAAGESVKSNELALTKISVSPFTALSANTGNDAADSDLLNEAMYAPFYNNGATHRNGSGGNFYLNVEGSGQGSATAMPPTLGKFDGYALTRFDTTNIKNQIAENFGAGVAYTTQAISLKLTENNQSFTHPGNILFNLTSDNTSEFGYKYADANQEQALDPFTSSDVLPNEELLEIYPFATTGTANQFSVDTVPLFGSAAIVNPTNPGAGTDLLAAFNNSANRLTFVARPQNADITAGTTTILATPLVGATWNAAAFTSGSTFVAQPQLVVVAVAAQVANTIAGTATYEGVAYPHTGGIALNPVTVTYYNPGDAHLPANVKGTQTITPSATNGSFSFTPTLSGKYDLDFKSAKSLSALVAGVDTSKSQTGVNFILPAGDANNDNFCDTSDFGVLVGVYGADSSVTGSGYDPAADFNYDGIVDTTDFGLLVGNYGAVGQ